ncbi:hypothetical protein [Spirosoma utsteinense]|uniref:hypothetical protein n=1 Tax=Spirosoma utsteinense TaxID=2585773 RepID=UPI001645C1DC|nr:hypothetical protein [Spirosoma utsteinense]MBC3785725.1 hypothetical protein [Spirosoma utsteinense]
MRYLATVLFVFLSLTTAQAQLAVSSDTSAARRAQIVPGLRELALRPGASGLYKLYVLTNGGKFDFTLDSLATPQILTKFNSYYPKAGVDGLLNLKADITGVYSKTAADARYRPISYVPTYTDISGKPTAYPSSVNLVTGLQAELDNKATNAYVQTIVSAQSSSTTTYPSATVDALLTAKEPLLPSGTTEQYLRANKTVGDLKVDVGKFASTANLSSYSGALNAVEVGSLGAFYYDATSTATIDNVVVLPATGKVSGRWLSVDVARRNVFDWGIVPDAMTLGQLTGNAIALQTALRSGRPLFMNRPINIYGIVTTNAVHVNLTGSSITTQIRQQGPFGVLDIGAGSESVVLENINLYPGVNVPGGFAVKINAAGGNNPNVKLINVVVNRGETVGGVTRLFEGGGFWLNNFGEGQISNCKYFGQDHTRGIALKLTNGVIAVSSTIRDFKVYGAHTGIQIRSTGNPGQEGTRILDADFVTTKYGIDASSDGTYGVYYPPQLDIRGCHFNCETTAIKLRRFTQFDISHNLIYLYNDNTHGGVGIDLDSMNEGTVAFNKFYKIGIGAVNGFVLGGFTSDIDVQGNYARMGTGDALGVINSGSVRTTAINNRANGTSFCIAVNATGTEYWGNFLNGILEPSSMVKTFTTAVVGPGGVSLGAIGTSSSKIYSTLSDTFTGINAGDGVDFARVGGLGGMPPEILISFQCVEAGKVRILIENTATTAKTFIPSQFTLKITRH